MSRSMSPRMLKQITVANIAMPGVSIHQNPSMSTFVSFCAWASISPQDAEGSWIPSPKNESAASPRTYAGIDRVAATIR